MVFIGCDSGFGHALAVKLDGIGFKVYAGCLNVRGEGAQNLKSKCSDRLHLLPLDVTQTDQVSSATQLVASTLEERSTLSMTCYAKLLNNPENSAFLYRTMGRGQQCGCSLFIRNRMVPNQHIRKGRIKIIFPLFQTIVMIRGKFLAYQMLEVNTLGTVRVTKAFLPLLRESQGRVVCVASMAGMIYSLHR